MPFFDYTAVTSEQKQVQGVVDAATLDAAIAFLGQELAQSGLPLAFIVGYFLYYNFLFVLPLIVVLILVWRARKIIQLKEWEHHAEKWMKLAIGLVLLTMGVALVV